jgi:putative FmdB family regulatory protein
MTDDQGLMIKGGRVDAREELPLESRVSRWLAMPLYEYRCPACGQRFERLQRFSDPAEAACPSCGRAAERLLSAIQFKGTGWYVTDYARKSAPAEKSESEAKSEGKSESDSKPAESKPASTD